MKKNTNKKAFTLVELILVMMLLATAGALIVPSLSKSFRGRNLDYEVSRFYSLTEYARDEAASQGVPMTIWIEPDTGNFGLKPKDGYPTTGIRTLQYTLCSDVRFSPDTLPKNGTSSVIEFSPSGFLEVNSVDSVHLIDRSNITLGVAKMNNGWGYEIQKNHEPSQN